MIYHQIPIGEIYKCRVVYYESQKLDPEEYYILATSRENAISKLNRNVKMYESFKIELLIVIS